MRLDTAVGQEGAPNNPAPLWLRRYGVALGFEGCMRAAGAAWVCR